MAILNFPNTRDNGDPLQDGDIYTGDNGVVYTYDGVKWLGRDLLSPLAVTEVATTSTAPTLANGRLWFNTIDGRGYVRYNNNWIDFNPSLTPDPATYLDGLTIDGTTITPVDSSSTVSIGTAGNIWTIGTDGSLIFPNDVSINPIAFDGFDVNVTDKTWSFRADGALGFPAGYILPNTIGEPGQVIIMGGQGGTYWGDQTGSGGAALGDRLTAGTTSTLVLLADGTLKLTHPTEWWSGAYSLEIQKAAGNYHTFKSSYGLSLQATPVPNGYGLNTNTNFVDIFHDGISVNVNDNTWGFGTDGKLTLPEGGAFTSPDYNFSFNGNEGDGVPTLGTVVTSEGGNDIGEIFMGSGYGEFRSIYNSDQIGSTSSGLTYAGVEGFNYAQYGDVNFAGIVSQTPHIDSMYTVGVNTLSQITIGFTQNGQTQESMDWSVVVGSLTTDYTVNGLFADTFKTVISGSQEIKLTTNRGTVLFGNTPEQCEPVTAGSHFHIMKDDPANVDLFFGDDFNYVKLPSTTGVEIGAGASEIWRFGTDGVLTLPSGNTRIGDISGTDGIMANTGTAFGVVTQGTGGYVALEWVDNIKNLGTTSTQVAIVVVNSPFASSTGTVQILTGVSTGTDSSNIWEFGATGTLTIPDDIQDANGSVVRVATTSTAPTRVNGQLWFNTIDGRGYIRYNDTWIDLNPTEMPAPSTYLDGLIIDGTIISAVDTTATVSIESGSNVWEFGTDGTTTFPNYTFQAGDGTAGQVLVTNGSGSVTWTTPIAATGNANTGDFTFTATTLSAATNQSVVLHTNANDWIFGSTGTLTVPGNIIPDVDSIYSLGSPTRKFKDLYVSTTTIYMGDLVISGSPSTGLTINGNSANSKQTFVGGEGSGPDNCALIRWSTGTNYLIVRSPGTNFKLIMEGLKTGNTFNAVGPIDFTFTVSSTLWQFDNEITPGYPEYRIGVNETNVSFSGEYIYLLAVPVPERTNALSNGIYSLTLDSTGTVTLPGNLILPAGGDIRDTTSNISVLKTRIGDTYASGAFQQLTIAHDEGKLITIAGGNSVFRLPQMTADMLGAEFEFYFSGDAGQIHIQSYYTGVRATTDVFRGSIYVGVDNATTGKLHKATATTATACDLFLGQHHAKVGSYVKVKAIAFNTVGTWMFQGMCVGDTGQTPNSSDHPFQDYN